MIETKNYEKALFKEIIGENITKYRLKRGLNRRQLAEWSQLDEKNLLRLEKRMRAPMALTLSKIAKALGVELNDLYAGTEEHIEVILVWDHQEKSPMT